MHSRVVQLTPFLSTGPESLLRQSGPVEYLCRLADFFHRPVDWLLAFFGSFCRVAGELFLFTLQVVPNKFFETGR